MTKAFEKWWGTADLSQIHLMKQLAYTSFLAGMECQKAKDVEIVREFRNDADTNSEEWILHIAAQAIERGE